MKNDTNVKTNLGFFARVYAAVKLIPRGLVASYGMIAAAVGAPKAARQVGWALHVNPDPSTIPCHRVVTKDGRCAPGFAFGGEGVQRELLAAEGVTFDGNCVKSEYFMAKLDFI